MATARRGRAAAGATIAASGFDSGFATGATAATAGAGAGSGLAAAGGAAGAGAAENEHRGLKSFMII